MGALDEIRTIVIVFFENRSFDHVFGHLRLPAFGGRTDVEGLVDPESNPAYLNFVGPEGFAPFPRRDAPFLQDPPHGRASVAQQLAEVRPRPGETRTARYTMSGFVQAYVDSAKSQVQDPPPMGFLTPPDVPTSGFLAHEYVVCDHWFTPLPNETFPNRCVAFTGESLIENGKVRVIPTNPGTLLFDWLGARQIPWRVYHSGISFFTLFGQPGLVLGDHFRNLDDLAGDMAKPPAADDPQVIVVEPEYQDVPVHFGRAPNDNHPPLPMGPGERLLRDIYAALSTRPDRWRNTLLVVTHDEPGGFFDHVAPPRIPTPPPRNALFTQAYESLGPRVPALVASPWVARGRAFNGQLDHTSILQLIAQKFTGSPDYSPEVARRRAAGILSLSAVLDAGPGVPRSDVPALSASAMPAALAAPALSVAPAITDNQKAFLEAGRALLQVDRARALAKFPALAHLP